MFVVRNGRLPAIEELAARDNGGPFVEELGPDPWGGLYVLREGEERGDFEVRSSGPNHVLDDEDDITAIARGPGR